MSKPTSILQLSLTGQHNEAAKIWEREVSAFLDFDPMVGINIYPADGPIRNLETLVNNDLDPIDFRGIFNDAVRMHDKITKATKERHVPLIYDAHHFEFDKNNILKTPNYFVLGPEERQAPAFLYNPVSPTDPRFGYMKSLAMDFDVATARLDALVDATGWDRHMVAELNFVRSVENWANRLVEEAKNEPKELPPYGQVDSKYWQRYTTRVAAPLAGLDI